MKLLPFFLTKKQGTLQTTRLTVFLAQGGRRLWETDTHDITTEDLVTNYLTYNGIVSRQIHVTPTIIYIEVDPVKTKIDDFYMWDEAYKHPQKPECWKHFYFFKDPLNANWFTPKASQLEIEFHDGSIQEYYEDILRLSTE